MISLFIFIWLAGVFIYFLQMVVVGYVATLGYSRKSWVVIPFMLLVSLFWPILFVIDIYGKFTE